MTMATRTYAVRGKQKVKTYVEDLQKREKELPMHQ